MLPTHLLWRLVRHQAGRQLGKCAARHNRLNSLALEAPCRQGEERAGRQAGRPCMCCHVARS